MKIALLIGINYTSSPEYKLHNSINNIMTMKKLLISHYGYVESNIFMLRDDDPSRMPTRSSIITALNDLVISSKSTITSTEICIHYCGHGSHIQNITDGVPKVDGIIIPVDYKTEGFIEDDIMFKCVSFIQCPVLLIMDCCNSGDMCDLEYGFTNRYTTIENKPLIKNPNIIMFSGSNAEQNINMENCDFSDSVFTNALLQSLKTNGYYKAQIGKVKQDIYEWLRQHGKSQKSSTSREIEPLESQPIITPTRKSILQFQLFETGVNKGYSNRKQTPKMIYHMDDTSIPF